jgi:DNA-binding FrmR family transcriptional regulator
MSETDAQAIRKTPAKALHGLEDDAAREDILLRLRRAEGQIRGIQRMIEKGEGCQSIGQQFSAVRKALDSTFIRMTLCVAEREVESMMASASTPGETKAVVLKDLETMLARML